MSWTLFKYIFKDLFRIFAMTSGALSGIMSFGGLLRPLTRQGLDIAQVGEVLTWFGPAMTTYSFPIAAVFATTVVYGRLSSDNELTACRASGLSLVSLSVAGPAFALGLIVAFLSLGFLCFLVPKSTLHVEKVLYSNLAKLIATQIERNHEVRFNNFTIFAQEAYLPPPGDVPKGQQQVVLRGPTIVTVDQPRKTEPDFRIPREFWTASQATVNITENLDQDQAFLTVHLDRGFKFPRKYLGAMQASVEETDFGPMEIPSPIREDVKFMSVFRLLDLYGHPADSRKLSTTVSQFVAQDQTRAFNQSISDELLGPEHQVTFTFEDNSRYQISQTAGAPDVGFKRDDPKNPDLVGMVSPKTPGTAGERPYRFRRFAPGSTLSATVVDAAELRFHSQPTSDADQMDCSITLINCTTQTPAGPVPRANFTQRFTVPMTSEVAAFKTRDLRFYTSQSRADLLRRQLIQLLNEISAELYARASFAISCLILVMVGCALGMIFRSGNFLTGFAVSFVPALLSITLIIAGQRVAGNIPIKGKISDPLYLGLVLIWFGNVVNLILGGGLLYRLHRR